MRRKKLLLAVLAIFFLSSYVVSTFLQNINSKPEISYITIQKWGKPEEEIEVPHTGEDLISVLDPQTVTEINSPLSLDNHENTESTEGDRMTEQDISNQILIQDSKQETLYIESQATNREYILSFGEVCADVMLILLGLGVVILLAYLTHQHFRR